MVHLFPLRIELMYEQREMAELGYRDDDDQQARGGAAHVFY